MTATYLWTNAALYLLFALWCTLRVESTARTLGYVERSAAGESEYRVIYGGLQLGLAAIFGWLATQPRLHEVGVAIALMLYVPIVAFRVVTLLRHRPPGATWAVAALEVALLGWGAIAWLRLP